MTREERSGLERSLASAETFRDASAAELEGYERARKWALAFGDEDAEDRAGDLAGGAEENLRYYTRQAAEDSEALAEADRAADNRAFEAGCGARR